METFNSEVEILNWSCGVWTGTFEFVLNHKFYSVPTSLGRGSGKWPDIKKSVD
jgi:hypothetical protein